MALRSPQLEDAPASLVARLRALIVARDHAGDGAHDLAHVERVWRMAERLAGPECDPEVLAAAAWLHDCVSVEKDSPERAAASRLAAEEAARVLAAWGWTEARIAAVFHAIHAHSYSAGVLPASPEACVLRDADRLDAMGAIGIARTFYVSGRLGRALYDPADIDAANRAPDDLAFAYDHFALKLLRLEAGMLTEAGRAMARARTAFMRDFLARFREEAGTR